MKFGPELTASQRVSLIEAALEKALDRGPEMSVQPGGTPGTLYVWVIERPFTDSRVGFALDEIAREIEVILS